MEATRDKATRGRRISTILLVAGALIFLIAGFYWASGYPWQLVLSKIGLGSLAADLPDPKPLPADLLQSATDLDDTSFARPDTLPGDEADDTVRPLVYMTQLGVIKLPKIGVSENVVEGTGNELLYAVGHMRGTALPGEAGNCALFGHRNYVYMNPFRHLDKIAVGDTVYVDVDDLRYTYEVYDVAVVGATDTWVMDVQEGESHVLTLITCTPVLNPIDRLVLWCRLTDAQAIDR